ncbi:MAG: hypothetical protein U0840_00400 [Gemmataceae bacterium]
MGPESESKIASLLSRYRILWEAELNGQSSPEMHRELQAIAGYLRCHYEAALAEVEKQLKTAAEARPGDTKRESSHNQPQAGSSRPARNAVPKPPPPPEPAPEIRTIDPHLGEKLRKQLLAGFPRPSSR